MQNQNGIQGAETPVCDEGAIAANPDYAQWHHRLHIEGHKNEASCNICADFRSTHDLSPSVRERSHPLGARSDQLPTPAIGLQVFNKSPVDMFGLVHANEFDNRNIADSPCSLEARCLHKKGKRIEREVIRETVSEQAEPALLREISKLLTLLWALVFEPKHILKMMN